MTKGGDKAKGSKKEKSLYEVLCVDKTATQQEIKKAYHKLALRLHPDKNPGDEDAKDKFQKLQAVFGILGDADKRKVYDETGCVDSAELGGQNFDTLYKFYRDMFKRVVEEDIEAFEEEYRGSEEEARDLKDYYTQFSGNMVKVLEFLMCSRPEIDSHRFKAIIDAAIAAGELTTSSTYKKWAKQVNKMPPVADPLVKSGASKRENKGKEDEAGGGLFALIKGKQQERAEGLFSSLEEKYGRGGKGKKKNAPMDEPSEEMFAAAQARLEKAKEAKRQKVKK